jgi:tetratricopeptide (TPR) repeat protein
MLGKFLLASAMARSIRVASECIPLVKQALRRRGFPSQNALGIELGLSRSTITSFFTGKPVYFVNFVEISERLGLDWQVLVLITAEEESQLNIPQSTEPHSNSEEAPETYNDRGVENYLAERLPQAVSDFTKALELDPNFAETHYNLGSLYEDLRDFDRARSEYRLAMLGGLTAAYNNLARLYILEKDYAAAVDLLLKGLKLAEHDAEKYALRKNLGWARLGQGRYAEAKAELLTAIDLDRKQASGYGLLAQALEGLGEKVEALVAWENCLRYASSYRPDEDTWIDLARQRLAQLGN